MAGATKCTCLRSGEQAEVIRAIDPTCPALAAGIHVGGNVPPATMTPVGEV